MPGWARTGTGTPHPRYTTLCTHTLCTPPSPSGTPPGGHHAERRCHTGYMLATACSHASKERHQAHVAEMEILSPLGPSGTVSQVHKWPAPDRLTTFQNAERIRVLIRENTKGNFVIWEQRDIFCSEKRKAVIREKQRIARKSVHAKVPFQSRINRPDSQRRSGSFSSWPRDPALVRVSCFRLWPLLTAFSVIDHFRVSLVRPA